MLLVYSLVVAGKRGFKACFQWSSWTWLDQVNKCVVAAGRVVASDRLIQLYGDSKSMRGLGLMYNQCSELQIGIPKLQRNKLHWSFFLLKKACGHLPCLPQWIMQLHLGWIKYVELVCHAVFMRVRPKVWFYEEARAWPDFNLRGGKVDRSNASALVEAPKAPRRVGCGEGKGFSPPHRGKGLPWVSSPEIFFYYLTSKWNILDVISRTPCPNKHLKMS